MAFLVPYDALPAVVEHLGTLHTYERWLVVVVAFGPFVVLGLVLRSARRRALAEEQAQHREGPAAGH